MPNSRKNLNTVYELVSSGNFFAFAKHAVQSGDPLIARRLGRFVGGSPDNKELTGILSTAMTNLRFLGNQAMITNMGGSGDNNQPIVDWKELRRRPTTVYIILPVRYLTAMSRWLRLCISSALTELLVEEKKGLPIVLLMDEFAALGHMSIVESTMSLSAGMGLTMLPVFQDIGQVRQIYGNHRADSFMSMAGYQMFLPPRDHATADYISGLSGEMEVIARSRSISVDQKTGEPVISDSSSQQGRRVLTPDEVMAFGRSEMLMRVEGVSNMIYARRKPYYECREYRGMWSPDPYHVNAGKTK